MARYKLKVLQDLTKVESDVKQNVKQAIRSNTSVKKNRYPLYIASFAALLACLLVVLYFMPNENKTSTVSKPLFTVDEMTLQPLNVRESTYIVFGLHYNGEKPVKLNDVAIVNGDEELLTYDEHHILTRFFMAEPNTDSQISNYLPDSTITISEDTTLKPGSDNRVILNVYLDAQYRAQSQLKLSVIYEVDGGKYGYVIPWSALDSLETKPFQFEQALEDVHATEEEKQLYETLKNSNTVDALKDIAPITVARMYWFANMEGNRELEYRLYAKGLSGMEWSYEDHLEIPPFDMISPNFAMLYAQDIKNGTFIESGENEGYIEFHSTIRNEQNFFGLSKTSDNIWQVNFMPMQ